MSASPHYVYRCFDAAGELLYVGRSRNPEERFRKGHSGKQWASDVATISTVEFPSLADAAQAERQAIQTENPRHNKADRWSAKDYRVLTLRIAPDEEDWLRELRFHTRIPAAAVVRAALQLVREDEALLAEVLELAKVEAPAAR